MLAQIKLEYPQRDKLWWQQTDANNNSKNPSGGHMAQHDQHNEKKGSNLMVSSSALKSNALAWLSILHFFFIFLTSFNYKFTIVYLFET